MVKNLLYADLMSLGCTLSLAILPSILPMADSKLSMDTILEVLHSIMQQNQGIENKGEHQRAENGHSSTRAVATLQRTGLSYECSNNSIGNQAQIRQR